MNRTIITAMIVCAVVRYVAFQGTSASAEFKCPEHASGSTVRQGNTLLLQCNCDPLYVQAGTRCVPAPAPSGRVGDNLFVDPKYLVDEYECGLIREQIVALTIKRRWLDAQRKKLEAQVAATTRAAKDVDEVTLELLQDSSVQSLNFIDASLQILAGNGAIPAGSVKNMRISISAAKAGLNAISANVAPPDSRRRLEKAGEAMFQFKDSLPVRPPGMSAEEWEAFSRASNIIPKMVANWERLNDSRGDHEGWRNLALLLDDLADFGGQYYAPLKASRSAVHIVLGVGTSWMMRRDRSAIDDAFVHLQTARRYYATRVGDVDQLFAFYDERRHRGCE
jgi:hypothetical protein